MITTRVCVAVPGSRRGKRDPRAPRVAEQGGLPELSTGMPTSFARARAAIRAGCSGAALRFQPPG